MGGECVPIAVLFVDLYLPVAPDTRKSGDELGVLELIDALVNSRDGR